MGAPGTTEGPWELYRASTTYYNGPDDAGEPFIVTAPNDGVILAVIDAVPGYEANAHQIAASGTLYDALKKLAAEVGALRAFDLGIRGEIGNTNWAVLMERLKEADAALAQARGEA